MTTILVLLAVGVHRKYHFHQLDVKTAFLHGNLQEDIYITIPDGLSTREGKACKLNKSIYGLKQSPRCWNTKLNDSLLDLGFKRSNYDYCLYTRFNDKENDVLFLVIYVDDMLIVENKQSSIKELKTKLSTQFEMSDCGYLRFFLGMKMDFVEGGLKISQETSIDKLLKKFCMEECLI